MRGGDWVILVCYSGAWWCIGGLHGLWLAKSQGGRMQKWADKVVALSRMETGQ